MSEHEIPENLYQMGQAFGKGAMALLDACLEDNNGHRADALIFPIAYLSHIWLLLEMEKVTSIT